MGVRLNKEILATVFVLVTLILLVSCAQDEGFGGNSHIKGKLVQQTYNDDFSLLLAEGPAKDENVFLQFGKKTVIGEKTESSYSGDFEFNNLWPGEYKIYYYSDDPDMIELEKKEMIEEITLGKGETLDLGELIVYKALDFDEGSSAITGRVFLINYRNFSEWPNLVVKDTTLAQEHEVYLTYGNHKQYDERIRTNHDGTFTFLDLIKGNYLVYLFSEDVRGGTEDIVIRSEVTISMENSVINLGDIYIEQL
ncbi:hypothetical protein QQ008_12675 [Fulvivirgaceae bacterium BMA10]|uniref:Carboxypeptidase regulatory-like domain-containing protein n=1 Tax=Splendidivirga corallicola TaxID=3051826 RepID=A0ABT8KND2_9BACT|nr:hypothetical protein [Fulvivirgaceae bacterium BMA10]